MNEIIEKIKEAKAQLAGKILSLESGEGYEVTFSAKREIANIEAQVDLYEALIGMCEEIERLLDK